MPRTMFNLAAHGTSVRVEILAGITTFLTMSYIIFVQPAVLSGRMFGMDTGMDFDSVMIATCLSAAIASAIMGLYANYPIAQAPGMGQNFFFVFTIIPGAAAAGFTNSWQVGLGVVFVSGILFLGLSLLGIREMLLHAISPSMKHAIAVGIGLFIAFIGVQNAGLVVKDPGTAVRLNTHFASPDLIIFFFGLVLIAALHARKVPGSILWGILSATALASVLKLLLPHTPFAGASVVTDSLLVTRFRLAEGIISRPPSMAPTFLKMDIMSALSASMIPFVVIALFMDMFDTIGTLIGVSEQAGLVKDNRLPRAKQAMLSDAIGTVTGAAFGTSTVTSYIESAAGVEQGGRTGLTAVVAAGLFLIAPFFSPVIAMIGSYGVITAPALVIVGCMMMQNVTKIDWGDYTEVVPSFLIITGIPFCYNIGDGLALGFISYPVIKFLGGRGRDVKWLMYVLGIVLIFYFIFARSRMG
ncbi:MAG: NCS2 family permease [Verrucomicrobia bacterium]|nr:NCS2 family permease [Verrucomicrobiota bacterium]